ncbi:MAG TPA: carbohydrate ABC transporter permease [Tepidisphaeraceae bacterium]|jgi:ABC-type glycerol-3-phosphate transport system permease component|nr:carbohydrate ABC transporter permease [Tepidisphaeraceae bacterium]
MKSKRQDIFLHAVLILFAGVTLLPFVLVLNNSLRGNYEIYHHFFALPHNLIEIPRTAYLRLTGQPSSSTISSLLMETTKGYRYAWSIFRPFMLNALITSGASALGVILFGSLSAYVFSRYRFPGHRVLFLVVLSFMMIPGVLTLVPSFLLVKRLHLINSYWALILPYVAGGQILAIFLFKSFFDALPQELFESARLDGANHLQQYWHLVLPLSKQIIAVVAIVNVLGTWNNFLWPQVVNPDTTYAVVSTGLFLMSETQANSDRSVMFAAYVISALPLLILFVYATKPFMQGITSGAFKA